MQRASLFLLLLLLGLQAVSQNLSNKGKEFWLSYSYHVGMVNTGGAPVMTLYITSDVATTYTAEIFGGATLQTGSINPGQVISVIIPNTYFINDDGTFNNKAIRVTAPKPIVVYSYITRNAVSGATLCLPTNTLGTAYKAMSFTQQSNEANSNSFITIIAVENNTTVEIIPTAATKGGWAAGSVNTITLNKGQIYQVLGTTTGNSGTDLSGTSVRSIAGAGGGCKRIAVFSGSGKVTIANGACSSNSSDNLYQQLYPISTWGKKYLTVPSANRNSNFYRVWRSSPTAAVTVNGVAIAPTAFTNDYYQFFGTTANRIESDQPIAVTQYFTTQGCNSNITPYDPDMIVLNPVEQNISNVTLISSNLVAPGVHQHYIHVIMKNAGTAISSFRFDGGLVPASQWSVHPQDPAYSYLYLSVAETSHTLACDSGFNAIAYGYANAESYGYSAGTNVIDLYQQTGIYNPNALLPTNTTTCIGSNFKFKISFPYQPTSLDWNFHGSFPNVTMSGPLTADSVRMVNGVNVYWYSLPGYYTYPAIGSYPVTVTVHTAGVDNCGSERDIDFEMTVQPKPTATVTFNNPACLAEPVSFNDQVASVDPVYQWNYNFGDGTTSINTTDPVHAYTQPGTYNTSFYALNQFGCFTDTISQQVVIPTNPSATISGTSTVCKNAPPQTVTFTGSGGVPPYTFTYTLNGGSNQTITTTGNNTTATITVPTSAPLINNYQLVSVSTGTHASCVIPAIGSATVTVRDITTATISGGASVCQNDPSPQVTFTGFTGPQPYTFTYNINGGAPQTIQSTGATAIINVPTNVAGVFTYNIMNVADASGQNCITPPTGSAVFSIKGKPRVSFTTSAPLCQFGTITFTPSTSIDLNNVVSWEWNFGDGNISTFTNQAPFTYSYNTPGVKTVSVKATSDSGCNTIFTLPITIHPKPIAGFINPNVCLADVQGAIFTDTSSVSSGTITNWNWDFGDAASSTNTSTLQNPSHYYNTTGPRTVRLIVNTNNNCRDTVDQQIMINGSIPVSNFTVNNSNALCSNVPVTITNTSTVDVGSIVKMEIYWDDVNQPTVFDSHNFPAPNSTYTHNYPVQNTDRTYRIRLRAFSGITCISDKIQTIVVRATPQTNFATVPPICLNNGNQQLTQGTELNNMNGTGVYTGTGVSSTGLFNPIVAGVGNHNLIYTFTTQYGCVTSDTQSVTVLQPPVASFNASTLRCNNTAITFTPTTSASVGTLAQWHWNFGDGSGTVTTTNNNPVAHTYGISGTYPVTLYVQTDYGCRSLKDSQNIVVNPTPIPQFTYSPSACLPQALITFTNTTPNVAQYNYQWNFGEAGSPNNTATATNPTHTYLSQGPFQVQLTATSPTTACTHDTIIPVTTIHRAPIASFNFNPSHVCIGSSMQVIDASQPDEGTLQSWSWNYGNSTTNVSGQFPPAYTYNQPGTYSIRLTATNSFGCTDDTVRSFTVYPFPVANAGPTLYILEGGYQTILSTASGNGLSYQWNSVPAGFNNTLSSTTVLAPIVTPVKDMKYLLTVTNDGGCIDTSSMQVIVLRNLEIPNTFSPNGDGINEVWTIKYLETYPQCKVQVFTRTGQKVFESRGYRTPWNGTANGRALPIDTYYYIIEPGQGRKPVSGYVTLIK